jgi:hypothetical protein
MTEDWETPTGYGLSKAERLIRVETALWEAREATRARLTTIEGSLSMQAERMGHVTRRVQDHGTELVRIGRVVENLATVSEWVSAQKARQDQTSELAAERTQYKKDAMQVMAYLFAALSLVLYLAGIIKADMFKVLVSAMGLGK